MGRTRDLKKGSKKEEGKTEAEETFELVIDKRHKFHGNILTVNSKLGRIVMSSQLYDYAKENYGKDFSYVQLLMISSGDPIFLIKPCDKEVPGARGVHIASGSRVISAKLLLQKMNWKSETGMHFNASWEEKPHYRALRVDLRKPLED